MQQTCVHLACARHSGQSAQIVKILLLHSNKDVRFVGDLADSLPLFTAIEAGNSNVCRELLSVDPGRQLSQTKQPLNDTAMHLAARRKDANLAKVLIEAGAQVDLQNKEGQTVLHLASIMGDDNMVRVLFMARANANLQDNEDRAPIHLAAERGYSTIVEFLVEKFKASIYERTRDGSTLMHIAAVNGHPETVINLIVGVFFLTVSPNFQNQIEKRIAASRSEFVNKLSMQKSSSLAEPVIFYIPDNCRRRGRRRQCKFFWQV